jgi:glutathione S-transferase
MLYVTPGSPYARMARMMVLEKKLERRVEVIAAETRTVGSPYYRINPSGRVPYLVRDDTPGVIAHEKERARRMADVWEREIGHPLMRGAFNMVQLTLLCCLGLEARNPQFDWRAGRPQLAAWFERVAARPSFAATAGSKAV